MNKKLLPFLIITAALSLSGCSFFDIITSNEETSSYTEWAKEKQKLTYTQKDLNKVYYSHNGQIEYMPTTGTPKLLVVPISFTDTKDFLSDTEKDEMLVNIEKVCFGTNEDTGWYSINSYFLAESYGACNIQGEVASWYECGYSYDYFTSSERIDSVVTAAVNNWKTNNPDKVQEFDSDSDGYIDGVIAVYGGPNYGNSSKLKRHSVNKNMWAYTTWLLTSPDSASPNPNCYIWASYDFMEKDISNGVLIDGHTYIHEMGHVMGLDDYYDYADQGTWAGGYSMQDYNVGGHDPYSMMVLGWVDPYVPTSSTTITINSFATSGDVVLLSPDFSSNSAFDEYILLELYTPTGVNEHDSSYQYNSTYPKGPTRPGIRIWHVDSRLLKNYQIIKKGKDYYSTYDSITNVIDDTSVGYIVGPTNTTYLERGGSDSNGYASASAELRPYHLLELIRKGDNAGLYTDQAVTYNYLFTDGDTFTLQDYFGYFDKMYYMNNGSSLKWSVKVDSVSSDSATIILARG
ncbi:MAG: hypothetical protein K5906_04310 [Bacilli bacterium]|nr:hypothetical protein [Bacilli bacterium]